MYYPSLRDVETCALDTQKMIELSLSSISTIKVRVCLTNRRRITCPKQIRLVKLVIHLTNLKLRKGVITGTINALLTNSRINYLAKQSYFLLLLSPHSTVLVNRLS